MSSTQFSTFHSDALLPTRKDSNAAGFDFFANENVDIPAGQSYRVKTGIRVLIPDGHVGVFHARFKMAFDKLVFVLGGVVNPHYTEEVSIGLLNLGHSVLEIRVGDPIAQLIVTEVNTNAHTL